MTGYIRLSDKQYPFYHDDLQVFLKARGGMESVLKYFSPVEEDPLPEPHPFKIIRPLQPELRNGKWVQGWRCEDLPEEEAALIKRTEELRTKNSIEAKGSVPDVVD